MKKIVSLLITAVMLLSLMPFSVFSVAAAETDAQGVQYTLSSNGRYYSVSRSDITVTEVVIPAEYNGLPVTSIGSRAFNLCSDLISITIPDSVTSISDEAIYGCSSLESITVASGNTAYQSTGNCLIEIETKKLIAGCKNSVIPNDGSVISIAGYSFYQCFGLTSINIPDSVTSIGNCAFDACKSLTNITIPNSVTSMGFGIFADCSSLESMTVASENEVYHSSGNCIIETETKTLFAGCKNSVIPTDGSVTSIGGHAFYFCSTLLSIEIPDSITSIGYCAFAFCENLTSINIPDSVTSIGINAFHSCTSLTDITIPDSVITIDRSAFEGCGLTSVVIPDSVTSLGDMAFYECENLTSVTISNSITSIYYGTFKGCKKLTSVEIPDSVTSIGWSAFNECSSLTSVTIPDSVTIIGDSAFADCESLTSITIPDSVTSIGLSVFYNCPSLTDITIPDSVTSIGFYAFDACTNLTDIYCEAESQPEGWDSNWNKGCDATIHWGYIDNTIDTTAVIGDINADGKIDSADYLLVKRACFGTYELSEAEAARANIDGSDKIDSADYALVKRIAFGTYVLSDSPVNVALNKTYTGTETEFPFECPYTANLTDGVASSEEIFNDAWFAFYYNASASVETNAPDGVATITIDLGQQYDDIQSVRMHIWQCNNYNIGSPESVIAYVSDNGTDFDEIGELVLPEANAPDWATLSTEDTSGRYVRLVITTSDTATWTFVNEIEVYA